MTILDAQSVAPWSNNTRRLGYRFLTIGMVILALTTLSDTFFTANNVLNILRQASLLFLLCSGLTLVILAGGLDLSIGANIALSGCLAAMVIKATGTPWLGAIIGFGVGTIIGLLNGFLVTSLRLPAFIATYGMMWVVNGLTYYVMAGRTIGDFPAAFRQLGSGYGFGIPIPVYLMAASLLIGVALMRWTIYGKQIYAIGANATAAELSGIPVRRRLLFVYATSGAMAGLAALVFLARLNSADANMGSTLLLPGLASVLVGGASLFGGTGSIFGTFTGAVLLTLILNGMNILSVSSNWQPLITGLIIVVAVFADATLRRESNTK
ncbi:ABC transporter permease [Bradyrhizobium prioriisuperbiae]|uniref:ABC transporter permease n=1 Tax=Bradyrhizobium prioriisuperbiae TaxID=2854389 RepID=UPI0028E25AAC|nr:ABC transporter permease [Bradyrhizobium prioritasuperba]